MKPASRRTSTLPTFSSFPEFRSFVYQQFATREGKDEVGIAREELCDLAEAAKDFLVVNCNEYS